MFFIPGAKMSIHARGSGFFFIKTVQYEAFLVLQNTLKST